MRCPNKRCKLETSKIITGFRSNRTTGKLTKIQGCPACYDYLKNPALYTGRKIWVGEEAYGKAKTHQMNMDWIDKASERAARNRRDTAYISPEAAEVVLGKRPPIGQFQ
jgi:hypothetical protein